MTSPNTEARKPLTTEEATRLLRTAYDTPMERDDEFWVRIIRVMLRPARVMSLTMQALNAAFYLFVICALGWLMWQALDRGYPVKVLETKLLTDPVAAGDPIRVRYKIDRLKSCRTTIRWTVVDGDQEWHEYGPIIIEAGLTLGLDEYVRGFSTSKNLVAGDGTLRVAVAYECPGNYLQGIFPLTRNLPGIPVTFVPANRHDSAPPP